MSSSIRDIFYEKVFKVRGFRVRVLELDLGLGLGLFLVVRVSCIVFY